MNRKLALLAAALLAPWPASAALYAVIVEGLGGESRYAEQFHEQVQMLSAASRPLAAGGEVRVFTGADATRDAVQDYLAGLGTRVRREDRVAVYLVGHGSYDGHDFKFNMPGPDLTGRDLVRLLDRLPTENQLLVSTGSASGSLVDVLKKESRVLITATRSGNERNATRFGGDFVAAFADASADTDKSGTINAQEAFEFASRRVEDFFKRETRLASEHPRLEGGRAARFTVAQLESAAAVRQSSSPERQRLAAERDAVNARIEELRLRREQMEETAYFAELETLLLELARSEERIEALDSAAEPVPGAAGGVTDAPAN